MVAAGETYANLAATVNAGTGNLGTDAVILAGTNNSGSDETIGMAFRTRATDELDKHMGTRTGPLGSLRSDVVSLTGVMRGGTDIYALQMSYVVPSQNEQSLASQGLIYLATQGSGGLYWSNAASGNTSGSYPTFPYMGSLSAFLAANPNLNADDGTWGVDTSAHSAWAILDYPGTFAVATVPEPGTLALLLASALACVPAAWRRSRRISR